MIVEWGEVTGPQVALLALAFVVGALATARLTRLAVEDEIAEPIRRRVLRRLDPDNVFHLKLVYLMSCQWCVSIWTGAAVAALVGAFPHAVPVWIALSTLAFSQITGILVEVRSRAEQS